MNLVDEDKPKKETPEEPSEVKEEEKIDEPQPEAQPEKSTETQDETAEEPKGEETTEEVAEEPTEEAPEKAEAPAEPQENPKEETETEETTEEVSEELPEEKSEEPVSAEEMQEKTKKQEKAEVKKDKPRKDRGPDFKYIVRLSNTDVDGEKSIVYGLTSVKGIGVQMATLIVNETGIEKKMLIGDLKDAQVEKLQEAIDNISKNAPGWMLNHRKNYETGEDIHLIGSEIDMKLRDEINIMKKIRSYRGIRHERGLPVRGQRTRANNRKGLALGVSKKREPTTAPAKE